MGDDMKINTKEKFINLLLATMAEMGLLVETYDFQKELLMMMSDRRYDDLFYFFEDMSDLDFTECLDKYSEERLIEVRYSLRAVTISILNGMFYPVADQILEKYDKNIVKQMESMLRELDLSRCLQREVYSQGRVRYLLSNPNGLHHIGVGSSVVTDGNVMKSFERDTGGIIVQEATFLTIQEFDGEVLNSIDLYYKFEDKRFVFKLVKEILTYYKRVIENNIGICEDDEKFEELDGVSGYKYKKYIL